MKIILSPSQMQECDERTINEIGIPSLVLMERAALKVAEAVETYYPDAKKFAVVCGPGNNGGDGVAVARILHLKGKEARCFVIGDEEKYTNQLAKEIEIAKNYGLKIETKIDKDPFAWCDVAIDAMFGIGLKRGLSGDYEKAAKLINECAKATIAVDIPSGFDANCGKLLGNTGIKADLTVSFAYMKKGLILGDCKAAAGRIIIADVGIYAVNSCQYDSLVEEDIISEIIPRPVDANKGTCGKLLVIAGSESIYGACYLSAKAALTTGAGLVKIYTHKNNIASIQQNLPEAMYVGYDTYDGAELSKHIKWADAILIGPGLGTDDIAEKIMSQVLLEVSVPLVIDADGINLISKEPIKTLFKEAAVKVDITITPHLKEMERLTGILVSEINYNMEKVAKDFATDYKCIVVLKNHTSIVMDEQKASFIISGNEALATPGSGDVLAGTIVSLIVQKACKNTTTCVAAATYMHGLAGTKASEEMGIRKVLASDIIDYLPRL